MGIEPDRGTRPKTPRWVKASAIIALVVVLLIVGLLLFGGGRHGPGRHTSTDDDRRPVISITDGEASGHRPPAGGHQAP